MVTRRPGITTPYNRSRVAELLDLAAGLPAGTGVYLGFPDLREAKLARFALYNARSAEFRRSKKLPPDDPARRRTAWDGLSILTLAATRELWVGHLDPLDDMVGLGRRTRS